MTTPAVALSALPASLHADPAFLALVVEVTGRPAEAARFRLTTVPLLDLAHGLEAPDAFLVRGPGHRERVVAMAKAYRAGGPEALPPIVLRQGERPELLDGRHRLAAAAVAGLRSLPAVTIIGAPARRPPRTGGPPRRPDADGRLRACG